MHIKKVIKTLVNRMYLTKLTLLFGVLDDFWGEFNVIRYDIKMAFPHRCCEFITRICSVINQLEKIFRLINDELLKIYIKFFLSALL